jgi:hypothetical protein
LNPFVLGPARCLIRHARDNAKRAWPAFRMHTERSVKAAGEWCCTDAAMPGQQRYKDRKGDNNRIKRPGKDKGYGLMKKTGRHDGAVKAGYRAE